MDGVSSPSNPLQYSIALRLDADLYDFLILYSHQYTDGNKSDAIRRILRESMDDYIG